MSLRGLTYCFLCLRLSCRRGVASARPGPPMLKGGKGRYRETTAFMPPNLVSRSACSHVWERSLSAHRSPLYRKAETTIAIRSPTTRYHGLLALGGFNCWFEVLVEAHLTLLELCSILRGKAGGRRGRAFVSLCSWNEVSISGKRISKGVSAVLVDIASA